MTRIYVITPWQWGKPRHDFLKKFSPNCSGKWKDIETCDNFDDADYYIAFWSGEPVLREQCRPKSVINVMNEPSWHIPNSLELGEETIASRWVTQNHNPITWWVGKTYSELAKSRFPKKTKLVSHITTSYYLPKARQYAMYFLKKFDRTFPGVIGSFNKKLARQITALNIPAGYRYRLNFVKNFTSTFPGVLDLYGKNIGRFDLSTIKDYKGPIDDKWEGLAPYRYSFAFENNSEKNYFDEKICDCILAGCMPLYWGCTNLSDFFPENSFVELDITKSDAVYRAMEIINSDFREQNLAALEKAKDLILNKYQFWPTIHEIIHELEEQKNKN